MVFEKNYFEPSMQCHQKRGPTTQNTFFKFQQNIMSKKYNLEVPFVGYMGYLPTFVPIHTRSTLVYEERELLYYV